MISGNSIRKMTAPQWGIDTHKLLVFIPEAFTPVCATEVGALDFWYDRFQELGCEVIVCCTDSPHRMVEWYNHEEAFTRRKFRTFSSYLLPLNLGLIEEGRAKRASVFITTAGEIIKQEHFAKVGRSFAELHRMLYGYTTASYCAEGWQSPADGFLIKE